jgi:hypothetical protein
MRGPAFDARWMRWPDGPGDRIGLRFDARPTDPGWPRDAICSRRRCWQAKLGWPRHRRYCHRRTRRYCHRTTTARARRYCHQTRRYCHRTRSRRRCWQARAGIPRLRWLPVLQRVTLYLHLFVPLGSFGRCPDLGCVTGGPIARHTGRQGTIVGGSHCARVPIVAKDGAGGSVLCQKSYGK